MSSLSRIWTEALSPSATVACLAPCLAHPSLTPRSLPYWACMASLTDLWPSMARWELCALMKYRDLLSLNYNPGIRSVYSFSYIIFLRLLTTVCFGRLRSGPWCTWHWRTITDSLTAEKPSPFYARSKRWWKIQESCSWECDVSAPKFLFKDTQLHKNELHITENAQNSLYNYCFL